VYGPSCDPLSEREVAYIPWMDRQLGRDPMTLRAIIERAGRELGTAAVVFRLPTKFTPLGSTVRSFCFYVERDTSAVRRHRSDDVDVVALDRLAESQFLTSALTQALVDGYARWGTPVSVDAAASYVRSLQDRDPTYAALLARSGDDTVAHLTYHSYVDEVTGDTFVEIVDSAVTSAHRGRGITEHLVDVLVKHCGNARILGSVICERGDYSVLDGLLGGGWRVYYSLHEATLPC
jgi:ribosomal protein S18 acetylase RimI-like enzyme